MKNQPASTGSAKEPPIADAGQKAEADVRRLLAADKCKQAVDLAKDYHKKSNTLASQKLLVEAYVARIEQFQNKGMKEEALSLLNLVQERFPDQAQQLGALQLRAAATGNQINELLKPLASDQTPAETKASIEAAIGRHVTDLSAIAICEVLPAVHPLRVAASAIWKAFLAVTAGPVTDADIALPEVSRRSPLAPWKLLVRAIAAFYRHDDEGCRRSLEGIPADSAPAPAAAALRAVVDQKKPATGIAGALYDRILSDDQRLRTALQAFDRSLDRGTLEQVIGDIQSSIQICSKVRPELVDRLRQHIFIACFIVEFPLDEITPVFSTMLRNAYFWRLFARASEAIGEAASSVTHWERFLVHAVAEKMFAESSEEAAAVWLHIADNLAPLSLGEISALRHAMEKTPFAQFYVGQSPEIAALKPPSKTFVTDRTLTPGRPFEESARIRPHAETFGKWYAWALRAGMSAKEREDILQQWHKARPKDVQPLIQLSSLAEARNALSLAIKRLGEAEAIDPLNKEVRQARIRLTLSITWRHFSEGKARLVEKDLADLAALPGMRDGDHGAALEAIRGAWHLLRKDGPAAAAAFAIVEERMGPIAASALIFTIKAMAKVSNDTPIPNIPVSSDADKRAVAEARARVLRLGEELSLTTAVPKAWVPIIKEVIRQRPCPLPTADILLFGRSAIYTADLELAYAASSAGLSRMESPAVKARLLLLRAQSLIKDLQSPRAAQCVLAALELAKQAHDEAALRDSFEAIDRNTIARRFLDRSHGRGLTEELLQEVLEKELKATKFPVSVADVRSVVVPEIESNAGTESLMFDGPDEDWDEDSDADDDWDDDDEEDDTVSDDELGLFDALGTEPRFPPAVEKRLRELIANSAKTTEQLLKNPFLLLDLLNEALGRKAMPQDVTTLSHFIASLLPPAPPPKSHGSKKRKKRRR